MRTAYVAHKDDNDFIRPGTLYRQVMSQTDRDHLVGNIVWHLSQGVVELHSRARGQKLLPPIDPDLGARVAKGLIGPSPDRMVLGRMFAYGDFGPLSRTARDVRSAAGTRTTR